MGGEGHLDQHIAIGPAIAPGAAAAFDPDLLAILDAGGNSDVDLFAILQHHPARAALHPFGETRRHRGGEILAPRDPGAAATPPRRRRREIRRKYLRR